MNNVMNLDYISPERFLEQAEKVQAALKDLIKDKYIKGDLVATHHGEVEIAIILKPFNEKETGRKGYYVITKINGQDAWLPEYDDWLTPCLNETQIIKIIESKGYKFIGINNFHGKWNVKVFKNMMQFEPDFEYEDDTRIDALFGVICKIVTS